MQQWKQVTSQADRTALASPSRSTRTCWTPITWGDIRPSPLRNGAALEQQPTCWNTLCMRAASTRSHTSTGRIHADEVLKRLLKQHCPFTTQMLQQAPHMEVLP